MTIVDHAPAIGSNFNPTLTQYQGGPTLTRGYKSTVIATGLHGENKVFPDLGIEQHVILVVNHQTDKMGDQEVTFSNSYTVYIAERVFKGDAPTDEWKVLYEHPFSDIYLAINGQQEQHARWATEAEKREPKPWHAGFADCLAR